MKKEIGGIMKKINVYVSSNQRFIKYWQDIPKDLFNINSTWMVDPVSDPGDTVSVGKLWERVFNEIRAANMVLVKSTVEDQFEGVLVEIGAALILGKPVYIMGAIEPIGDVVNHRLVFQVESVIRAIDHYKRLFVNRME